MEHAGQSLRIAAGAGATFAANLFHPQTEPAPAVLIVPEMYGVNSYINAVGAAYAAHGLLTLVMDVLWRVEPELVLAYTGADTVRAHALHDAFDFTRGAADMQAALDRLRALPECTGKAGVVGFCLGGTMAYVAALHTNADAAVDYYGSRAVEFAAAAETIATPLMLHTGSDDGAFPPGGLESIETAAKANPNVVSFTYAGARHAFANPLRPDRYDAAAAQRAQRRTFVFFERHLR